MFRFTLAVAIALAIGARSYAEEPVFDAIDYANPAKYLAFPSTLGDADAITKQAAALKSNTERATVANVLGWMEAGLRYDDQLEYEWRNYDTVVNEGCYLGCADQAITCGVLLKSAGIPTVWVKTMDVPWIWGFKKQRPMDAWSGHVFLEIYLDKQWVLLDPGGARIYEDYSTKSRILPGNRFAYHKGNDPKQMIMSLQWEEWKQQTAAYFTKLDESLLPVDPDSAVSLHLECSIAANAPYYQFLTAIAQQNGFKVTASFNNNFDRYLAAAKGQTILVETHSGVPIIELDTLERHYPSASAGLETGKAIVDGTTIVFLDFGTLLDQIAPDATD